jgi:hypothetical protein
MSAVKSSCAPSFPSFCAMIVVAPEVPVGTTTSWVKVVVIWGITRAVAPETAARQIANALTQTKTERSFERIIIYTP